MLEQAVFLPAVVLGIVVVPGTGAENNICIIRLCIPESHVIIHPLMNNNWEYIVFQSKLWEKRPIKKKSY